MMDPFPLRDPGDPLDRLLEAARFSPPHPWLATRTLARCLNGEDDAPAPVRWNALITRWALAGVLVLSFAGVAMQQVHRKHELETHRQQRVQEAFEVMAALGGDEANPPVPDNSL